MTNIKLIALDMDGTLLNDDGVITPYTQKVIEQAQAQQVTVVLSTGRPLSMCTNFAEQLGLHSYLITANGAETWTFDHKLLERHLLDASKIRKLWEIGNKHKVHMWLVATDNIFIDDIVPENFSEYDWLKIGYGRLTENEKQLLLNEICNDDTIEISNSSTRNIEITKSGVHKARAIRSLCTRLQIKMEEVMAIGDSLNDIKMIEQAGIGVAMQNAQEKVLQAAGYITASNNEDGVAKAIEKFVL